MKRDSVAPMRKAKIPIPVAPINRDLRQATGYFGIFAEILRILGIKHLASTLRLGPRGGIDTTSI